MKLDLDPSLPKVVAIGVLEFLIAVLGAFTVIWQEGKLPTQPQTFTILGVAAIALFTYLATFIKSETE